MLVVCFSLYFSAQAVNFHPLINAAVCSMRFKTALTWFHEKMEEEMRVLIMCDMEGVSGIVAWQQVDGGAELYEEGRRLYTEEINAAVRGAKAAGAEEIVVVDCHGAGSKGGWNFNSLIPKRCIPTANGSPDTHGGVIRRCGKTAATPAC